MMKEKTNPNVEAQLDDFFTAPVESAPHTDHLYGLRVRLLEAGHIQTLMQKYVYTDEAKEACLEWYLEDLARQDELGSTGSWGKQFEVESRISYAIRRGVPFSKITSGVPEVIFSVIRLVNKGTNTATPKGAARSRNRP